MMMQKAHVPAAGAGFRPKEYAHIVLATPQPQALIDWYCKVLGLQLVMATPMISFLTWDDSQDRLAIVSLQNAQPRGKNTPGLHHAAFEVESLAALVGQYRALKADGILPLFCMNHGVATSLYYADPDGNQIELTIASFKTREELNQWFGTGAFDANPVGVILDPEDLCRRVDSGEAEDIILRPAADHATALPQALRAMAERDANQP